MRYEVRFELKGRAIGSFDEDVPFPFFPKDFLLPENYGKLPEIGDMLNIEIDLSDEGEMMFGDAHVFPVNILLGISVSAENPKEAEEKAFKKISSSKLNGGIFTVDERTLDCIKGVGRDGEGRKYIYDIKDEEPSDEKISQKQEIQSVRFEFNEGEEKVMPDIAVIPPTEPIKLTAKEEIRNKWKRAAERHKSDKERS